MIRRLLLLALLAGCAQTLEETPCPPTGTTLGYESFGRGFMDRHCQGCHGVAGPGRRGAPGSYDFGTLALVRGFRERIFVRAAGANTTMPPGPDDPAEDERQRLAEWLSCGAPE